MMLLSRGRNIIAVIAVVAVAVAAGWMSGATLQLLTFVLIAVVFAQSINVLTGLAGEISLGHAGLFAIGAYTTGAISKNLMVSPLLTVPLAILMGALMGLALSFPAGRVREVYLAMMTLGFGMVAFEVIREWQSVTGGVMGMSGVPSVILKNLSVGEFKLDQVSYFRVVLLVTALVLAALHNLAQSRIGRALMAVQHNVTAAGSLAISPAAAKRQAYCVSGALAGLAGAFYAHLVGYLGPDSFGLPRSVEILVISIVGGLGSITGQVVSAAFFTLLPERLQVFSEYQYIIYGLILAFSLVVMPKGMAGLLLPPPRYIRWQVQKGSAHAPAAVEGRADLEVENLTVRFGGLVALDSVCLRIAAGKITALIGPNGSGKSTLINVVSGIYKPHSGAVRLNGKNIEGGRDFELARAGIIRTFQDPRLVPSFTVRENLLLGYHRRWRHSFLAACLRLPSARADEREALGVVDHIIDQIGLRPVADTVVAKLPYGSMRLAEVGRALAARPLAILLDEPAAGLSEVEIKQLVMVIRRMKEAGLTVLLVDHHMDFIAELVDEVVVLDSGKVIFRGTVKGMRKDPTVIEAYLGVQEMAHA